MHLEQTSSKFKKPIVFTYSTRQLYVGIFQCLSRHGPVHSIEHMGAHSLEFLPRPLHGVLCMGPKPFRGAASPTRESGAPEGGLATASGAWGDVHSVCRTEPAPCTPSRDSLTVSPGSTSCSSWPFAQGWPWGEPGVTWITQTAPGEWPGQGIARWAEEMDVCRQNQSGLTCKAAWRRVIPSGAILDPPASS